MAIVQVQLPSVFKGIVPFDIGNTAIELPGIESDFPDGVFYDIFNRATKKDQQYFVVVTRKKRKLMQRAYEYCHIHGIVGHTTAVGYRIFPSKSEFFVVSPERILKRDFPVEDVDTLLICEAESISPGFLKQITHIQRKRTIVVGAFCNRDHWFYNFARHENTTLHRRDAKQLLSNWSKLFVRIADKEAEIGYDAAERVLYLKDIELKERELQAYLSWVSDFLKKYTECEFSKMHLEFEQIFFDFLHKRDNRAVIIGPRGSAKSTHGAEALPLFAICHGLEKYILIIADTSEQAEKHLAVLRDELENNEEIAQRYPHVFGAGEVWHQSAIQTRNGIRVEALGAGKKVRGRRFENYRPTLIIVDDPEGDEAAYSASMRTKRREWFEKAVMKAGSPNDTNYLVIGSNIHQDCLVAHLNKMPGWGKHLYKSIIKWPDRMDLWEAWEKILRDPLRSAPEEDAKEFLDLNYDEMHKGSEVLWPEREPLSELMMIRVTNGKLAFESEKQNNPIDPSKCEWGPELFENRFYSELPKDIKIIARVSALDPSKGKDAKNKGNDFQAMVSVTLDDQRRIWIDCDLNRRTMVEMITKFAFFLAENESEVGVCEAEQFQELILPEIEKTAFENMITTPIDPILTKGVNKILRIRRLGPWINRGKMFFKNNASCALLMTQLQEFPNSDHDDGPDALEMALRKALEIAFGDDYSAMFKQGNPF